MDITDIQKCADFYRTHFLETFYLLTTYNRTSFVLIGEKENFPHLMGITKNTYISNGYNRASVLFNDIIGRNPINHRIIPHTIATTSKMYKKALNFQNATDIFWKNDGPLAVNFDPTHSATNLGSVDILLCDIANGLSLGWVEDTQVTVNGNVHIKKYCISTWIDESAGTVTNREKYMPNQDIGLIRHVFAFDANSDLVQQKEYSYNEHQKTDILRMCERNSSNLLIDSRNVHYYTEIATKQQIHCRINGVQY